MSHVITSYVYRKNMLYNQTSLKVFSTFSTISLAFSIASVIPALVKPFIAISLSSCQSKLVSYIDSSNEEEEKDLHVDVNFDEPIDLAIN